MENLNVIQENETPLNNVLFVVLLNRNESFGVRAPYDLNVMGKKMWEWVALTGDGATIKSTPCTEESDILTLIKPFVKNEEYTMVFYSDTPLISRESVIEILEYVKSRDLNVLKLARGYVFNSEYLLNCESIMATENKLFDGEEFEKIDSFEKLEKVNIKLRDMILKFHMENGVYIKDKNSTFIDADVVIEKGVVIEPNNIITGESYIGEKATLESNNVIKDSIISNNVIVKSSYISNSRIAENMIVGPFESVINKNC